MNLTMLTPISWCFVSLSSFVISFGRPLPHEYPHLMLNKPTSVSNKARTVVYVSCTFPASGQPYYQKCFLAVSIHMQSYRSETKIGAHNGEQEVIQFNTENQHEVSK